MTSSGMCALLFIMAADVYLIGHVLFCKSNNEYDYRLFLFLWFN